MTVRGWLLQLSYRLSHHYIGSLSVGLWIVIIALLTLLVDLLPRVSVSPTIMLIAGIGGLLLAGLLAWGKVSSYCYFRSANRTSSSQSDQPMRDRDQIRARATGTFAVEGSERFFANLEAVYHSFATREHAVMAHVPVSRFLLLAKSQIERAGMWYRFVKPEDLLSIEPGALLQDRHQKPAIRITYRGPKRSESMYLAFDTEADQRKVASDLLYDYISCHDTGIGEERP